MSAVEKKDHTPQAESDEPAGKAQGDESDCADSQGQSPSLLSPMADACRNPAFQLVASDGSAAVDTGALSPVNARNQNDNRLPTPANEKNSGARAHALPASPVSSSFGVRGNYERLASFDKWSFAELLEFALIMVSHPNPPKTFQVESFKEGLKKARLTGSAEDLCQEILMQVEPGFLRSQKMLFIMNKIQECDEIRKMESRMKSADEAPVVHTAQKTDNAPNALISAQNANGRGICCSNAEESGGELEETVIQQAPQRERRSQSHRQENRQSEVTVNRQESQKRSQSYHRQESRRRSASRRGSANRRPSRSASRRQEESRSSSESRAASRPRSPSLPLSSVKADYEDRRVRSRDRSRARSSERGRRGRSLDRRSRSAEGRKDRRRGYASDSSGYASEDNEFEYLRIKREAKGRALSASRGAPLDSKERKMLKDARDLINESQIYIDKSTSYEMAEAKIEAELKIYRLNGREQAKKDALYQLALSRDHADKTVRTEAQRQLDEQRRNDVNITYEAFAKPLWQALRAQLRVSPEDFQDQQQRKDERPTDFAQRLVEMARICVPEISESNLALYFLKGLRSLDRTIKDQLEGHRARQGTAWYWPSCESVLKYLKHKYPAQLALTPTSASASASRVEARDSEAHTGKGGKSSRKGKAGDDSEESGWTQVNSRKRGGRRGRSRSRQRERGDSEHKERSRSRSQPRRKKGKREDSRAGRGKARADDPRQKYAEKRKEMAKVAAEQGFKKPFSAGMLEGKVEALTEVIDCKGVRIQYLKFKPTNFGLWVNLATEDVLHPHEVWPRQAFNPCCGTLRSKDERHSVRHCSRPASKALADFLASQKN